MQNNKIQIVFLFLSISVLVSCHRDAKKDTLKDASPYFTGFFNEQDESVLRTINFNISEDDVKKIETSKLYESTPDHLFYEFSYPKDSTPFSEYANVQYFFNENNQLDIITADIYLNDSTQENSLRNTLTTYYNSRFGNAEKDDFDNAVWNGKFIDKKEDKEYKYTVALKELNDDFGITVEYVRE